MTTTFHGTSETATAESAMPAGKGRGRHPAGGGGTRGGAGSGATPLGGGGPQKYCEESGQRLLRLPVQNWGYAYGGDASKAPP